MNRKSSNKKLDRLSQYSLKPVYAAVLLAFAVQTAEANPIGGSVSSGSASFATSGNTLTVTNTPGTIINWQGFSIGSKEITNFAQQSASSTVLNRVVGNDTSSILGTLQSNGRVFLINPNGIVFGAGAVVDVAGLVASTLNLSDNDFLAGNYHFTEVPGAQNLSNAGVMSAQEGGQIYLIAPNVENTGVITAPSGEILLAAGASVDLVNTNDPNLRVNITAAAGNVTNVGKLIASSGSLGLFGTVVGNAGVVSADSATMQGGRVVFKASQRVDAGGTISAQGVGGGSISMLADMQDGTVNVTGDLDASAPVSGDGGNIETSAAQVQVTDTARIDASATKGNSGSWLIDPLDVTISATTNDGSGTFVGGVWTPTASGSFISSGTIQGALNVGTSVTITTVNAGFSEAGDINVNAPIAKTAGAGATLTLLADNNINFAIGASISSSSGALNLVLRSDADANNTGTVTFAGLNTFSLLGGRVDLYYNPASYSDTATKSDSVSNPYSGVFTSTPYTAWMLVNDVGLETGGTLGLQAMSTNLAGNYALGKDVAAATSLWNAGAGFAPIGNISVPFTGSFDGQGHTIDGLFINLPGTDYVGLFGFTQASTIKNVSLTNVNISGNSYVGSLVGWHQGTLTNSSNPTGIVTGTMDAGSLTGNSIGGLVGINYNNSIIFNCNAGSTVSGDNYVGGLVGSSQQSTISNSSASGTVTGTNGYVGGLAGSLEGDYSSANATNITATGDVNGVYYVGGMVGWNGYYSYISNGVASGTVSGTSDVGGLVGRNAFSISNSHATGSVTGVSNVGGLVGNNLYDNNPSNYYTYGSVSGSYANTGSVTGVSNVGGLVGYNAVNDSVSASNAGGAVTGNANVGGLVGNNDRGSITTGYATGSVIDSGTGSTSLGGLVGNNSGIITNSYVTIASVTGVNNIGGLVGNNQTSYGYTCSITGSFVSGGSVTGTSNVGGLAGNNNGTINNSHYNINGVTINGGNYVTLGGLYNDVLNVNSLGQYDDWFNGGLLTPLSIANYSSSLVSAGGNSYKVGDAHGMKDLLGFADNASYSFSLSNSIDLSALPGWYVPNLAANFDGTGYTLSNLDLNQSFANSTVGLFGHIASGVAVSNITLANASVKGTNNVGALAGLNDGTIDNSSVSGTVSVTGAISVGGLVGNNNGTISNTIVSGTVTVTGANSVGGLVGNNNVTISNTSVSGTVSVIGADSVGGLVGYNAYGYTVSQVAYGAQINNSYVSSGSVTGTQNIGGLVGRNDGVVSNGHYNVDAVTLNGVNAVTLFGLYSNQYLDWYNSGALTPLDIANYSSLQGNSGIYTISSVQGMKDLLGFADAGYTYTLASNLTLPVGYNVPFLSGNFKGGGHTLSGFNLDLPNYDLGLFGHIATGSSVSDLGLLNASVQGMSKIGALAGWNEGNISNSYISNGSVTGTNYVGGLVGYNSGNISNSYISNGSVTGTNYVGGMIGYNDRGEINSSHADAVTVSGNSYVGGLVGENYGWRGYASGSSAQIIYGTISNSYVSNGSVNGGNSVGGLVGYNDRGNISNSYADTDTVTGTQSVGGLVGYNSGATSWHSGVYSYYAGVISNSYASNGTVSGASSVGGLVGYNTGQVDNSYVSNGNVSGSWNVGGLVGWDGGEGNGYAYSISNSHVIASSVAGTGQVGGLVGKTDTNSNIDTSYVGNTTVTGVPGGVANSSFDIGGLAGYNNGTISNSYVSGGAVSGGYDVGGLVGYNNGTLSDSYVSGGLVSGSYDIGGLVGFNNGSIGNSYVNSGSVTGSESIGGMVGYNNGSISNSYASGGMVSGSSYIGGLAGYNYGTISNSYVSNGSVIAAVSDGSGNGGGLVGYNSGTISTSFVSNGSVHASGFAWYMGGLVGNNTGTITDTYASGGVVNGSVSYAGGLAGYNSGSISTSYASNGVVSGGTNGGLVGYDSGGTVSNSFWNTTAAGAGVSDGIGSVSGSDTPGVVYGMSDSVMKTMANFNSATAANGNVNPGWDISASGTGTVWRLADGQSMPLLSFFNFSVPGVVAVPAVIDEIVDISNQREKRKVVDLFADTSTGQDSNLQNLPICN